MATAPDVTGLLDEWTRGDHRALDRLLPLVYAELRRVAARQVRRERDGHSLQPTALVHEAYSARASAHLPTGPRSARSARLGVPLHLQRHRIRSGRQTIRITVPREPARAGVDPWRTLIEREREDNVVEVKAAGADSVGS